MEIIPVTEFVHVTAKILRLRLTQKLNNYRGSDVRGDRQFKLNLLND